MEKFIGVVVFGLVLIFVLAFLMAFPTMWLVNYILSDTALVAVFGGPLTFWKALALNFVCSLLFKSSGSTSCKCK
jgi:uncharacterized membrane protein